MREPLIDDEGENQAVRCFLMLHGERGVTVEKMKRHMELCGYPLWPAWVETPDAQGHLTKAGAQLWLRHLFALEVGAGTTASHAKALNSAWERDPDQ